MREIEDTLHRDGYRFILGIDEVGRGALAGPLVVSGVILDLACIPDGITDSKKLSLKKREALFPEICASAIGYHTLFIEPDEIDELNIYRATQHAMIRVATEIAPAPDYVLSDAMPLPGLQTPVMPIVKGDSKSVTIAAASILAKVTRDRYMKELASSFPGYGFETNVGYGAKKHLTALKTLGASPIHRRSFAPVAEVVSDGRNLF